MAEGTGTDAIRILLPWPPTMNTYWRRAGSRIYLSPRGRVFKELVSRCVAEANADAGFTVALDMTVDLYPPDRRRRDVDNYLKAILDALQGAGVYKDDSQITRLLVRKHGEARECGGAAMVSLRPATENETAPPVLE